MAVTESKNLNQGNANQGQDKPKNFNPSEDLKREKEKNPIAHKSSDNPLNVDTQTVNDADQEPASQDPRGPVAFKNDVGQH